ncbi:MAG: hypothetical protein K1X74_00410 [Pirellulales bacterium]|nr:hypothetical protein [Pirellulales bacterium]
MDKLSAPGASDPVRRPVRSTDRSPLPQAAPAMRSPARVARFAVALAVAGMCIVHSFYFAAGPYYDDFEHRALLQQVARGDRSLGDFVWAPHNEHFIPLWRLWYYASWTWFRDFDPAWHVAMSAAHLAIGLGLFVLLRRYLSDPRAAAAGACVWLLAAIGSIDNPLLWISASHLSLGLAWIVGAMVCQTRCAGPRPRRWALALGVCMVGAVTTMGTLWLVTLVLPVQALLLERRTAHAPGDRARRSWPLAVWLVTFLVLGAWTVPLAIAAPSAHHLPIEPAALVQAVGRACANFAVAWTRLWIGQRPIPPTAQLAMETVLVLGLIAALAIYLRVNVRLLAVLAVLCLPYTILVHLARLDIPAENVLDWGRYGYVPTLAWCGVLALLADRAAVRWAGRGERLRTALALAAVGALVWLAWVQVGLARSSGERFAEIERDIEKQVREYQPAMMALAGQGDRLGHPVRLLEIPLGRPHVPKLSTVVECLHRRIAGRVQVTCAERYTDDDFQAALAALRAAGSDPVLRQWETLELDAHRLAVTFRDNSRQGLQQSQTVEFEVDSDQAFVFYRKFIAFHFPHGLPGVRIVLRRSARPVPSS